MFKVLAIVVVLALGLAIMGCEGGGGTDTGAAAGFVYQPIGGGTPIISASAVPPPGYEPVVGATVFIEGFPGLTTTTNANGRYYIPGIPPGQQMLVAQVPGQPDLRVSIPIIAGHVTLGTGHDEGGGGVF